MKRRLPDKASDLLELALDDAQAVQRRKGVTLDMDYWLVFEDDGTCTACWAGAVMLRSLGVESGESSFNGEVEPCDIVSDSIAEKLHRINDMRCGVFGTGDRALEIKLRRLVRSSFSHADGRAEWSVYRKCVRILREHGL
jgi:hypothetical protein